MSEQQNVLDTVLIAKDIAVKNIKKKKKKTLPPQGLHFNQERQNTQNMYFKYKVQVLGKKTRQEKGIRNDPGERNENSDRVESP